jgi:acetate kinase
VLTTSQILTINGGSSSIKFALFAAEKSPRQILKGQISRIGLANSTLQITSLNEKESATTQLAIANYQAAADLLMDWIKQHGQHTRLIAIGHRVVHVGPEHSAPEKINPELIETLQQLCPLDPEHLPGEILLINAFHKAFPNLPQFACFDTAFYNDLPHISQLLPIPRKYFTQGIRRYGFHGLSYAFLMDKLERTNKTSAQGRIILAHLGNGASLTAVHNNQPIDTSMAFTPSSGVPMSTRSGDLDPGLLGYLSRTENMSIEQFNTMINTQSGLLGLSETSADMHDLLMHEADDIRAADAIAFFCYNIKKWIGAFAATLNGVDTVIFSGGIGENSSIIRSRICAGLEFLGIELDKKRNATNAAIISINNSPVTVRVIHTNEEYIIAKTIHHLLNLSEK